MSNPTLGADPLEASRKIIKLASLDEPPKILILGQDAFSAVSAHIDMLTKALEDSQQWSKDNE